MATIRSPFDALGFAATLGTEMPLPSYYEEYPKYHRWLALQNKNAYASMRLSDVWRQNFAYLCANVKPPPVPSTWSEYSALMSAEPMGNP